LSGLILFFLPPGMVMAIATLNRPYLDEMIGTSEGQIMLVASSVLLLVGGAWLKRLSRFAY
jgi:Flp pilus assembly protein TadB